MLLSHFTDKETTQVRQGQLPISGDVSQTLQLKFELCGLIPEPTSPEPTAAEFGDHYSANTWVTSVCCEGKGLRVENKALVSLDATSGCIPDYTWSN